MTDESSGTSERLASESSPMTSHMDNELSRKAEQLLLAHHGERPLLLPNAWDVASAQAVVNAGFPVVATSSRAVAQVFGESDDDSSDPDVIFSFVARIARAVPVPVTADLQAGFRLPATEFVDRLLEAGVVGCNLEDTDHHGDGVLVDAERQASCIAAVRAASDRRGVHIVVNARIDTFIRQLGDESARIDDAVLRGKLYLQAGADCTYPIAVSRHEDAAALVAAIPGPVNFLARKGALSIAESTALGARRISLASGVFNLLAERHAQVLCALADGIGLSDI